MRPFSFVHAADLHLDCPFAGLSSVCPEIQQRLRNATFRSLERIVDLCLREGADFLLLAGDVFNDSDRSLRAQTGLQAALSRLAEKNIPAFVVHGNHDHLAGWRASISWPDNVQFFSAQGENVDVIKDGIRIASISGISYPSREVTVSLADSLPKADGSLYSIALLHCNLGSNPEHGNYSPCNLSDLLRRDFDYWALGHVHKQTIVHPERPVIAYPGSSQGLSTREVGEHGCYLVRVEDAKTSLRFIPTDDIRWHVLPVNIEGLSSIQDLLDELGGIDSHLKSPDPVGNIVRIQLTGRGALHKELSRPGTIDDILEHLRSHPVDPEGAFTWVESIQLSTGPDLDKAAVLNGHTFLADFLNYLTRAGNDAEVVGRMQEALQELYRHPQIRRWLSPPTESEIKNVLPEVESKVLDLLLEDDSDG